MKKMSSCLIRREVEIKVGTTREVGRVVLGGDGGKI